MQEPPSTWLTIRLDYICDLQRERPCILTGFYLNSEDLELLLHLMTFEDLRAGAVGRYRNIPVYERSTLSTIHRGKTGDYEGIVYSFADLDVAN